MAMTNVELYEALKGHIGEKAARMIAEVVPPARNLATKDDVSELSLKIAELRGEMREGFAVIEGRFARIEGRFEGLEGKFGELKGQIYGRMLTMFLPLWLGVFGIIATLLVKL